MAIVQSGFWDIFRSPVFISGLISWFLAQSIKVVTTLVSTKKLDITKFVSSGGMPSSHASSTIALAVATGMREGFGSSIFAVSAGLTLVVMYDAAGVRRAAGKQAAVLNEIIELIKLHKHIEPKLKELLGHTPVEVLMGAILGIIIAVTVSSLMP